MNLCLIVCDNDEIGPNLKLDQAPTKKNQIKTKGFRDPNNRFQDEIINQIKN